MWRRYDKLAAVSKHDVTFWCDLSWSSLAIAMFAIAPCGAEPVSANSDVRVALETHRIGRQTVSQTVGGPESDNSGDRDLKQEELEVFATAFAQMVELREEANTDMAAAISSENFTPQQYLDIRDGGVEDLQTEDMARFLRAEVRVNRVRETLELEMQEVVEEEGMTKERFQEIFTAVAATPDLQERLQRIWQKRL